MANKKCPHHRSALLGQLTKNDQRAGQVVIVPRSGAVARACRGEIGCRLREPSVEGGSGLQCAQLLQPLDHAERLHISATDGCLAFRPVLVGRAARYSRHHDCLSVRMFTMVVGAHVHAETLDSPLPQKRDDSRTTSLWISLRVNPNRGVPEGMPIPAFAARKRLESRLDERERAVRMPLSKSAGSKSSRSIRGM